MFKYQHDSGVPPHHTRGFDRAQCYNVNQV